MLSAMKMLMVCSAPMDDPSSVLMRVVATVDMVVAVDGGAAHCLAAGIDPDLVIGDLDSLDARTAQQLRARGVAFRTVSSDKDVSDLDLALEYASQTHAVHVVACGVTGGRLDHTLASIGSIARARVPVDVVETGHLVWTLSMHHRDTVTVPRPGATFSVFGIGERTVVSIDGARWPLDHAELGSLSAHGLSNLVDGAHGARVTVHQGACVVIAQELIERSC